MQFAIVLKYFVRFSQTFWSVEHFEQCRRRGYCTCKIKHKTLLLFCIPGTGDLGVETPQSKFALQVAEIKQ